MGPIYEKKKGPKRYAVCQQTLYLKYYIFEIFNGFKKYLFHRRHLLLLLALNGKLRYILCQFNSLKFRKLKSLVGSIFVNQ